MFYELEASAYEKVRPLLAGMEHNLIALAVLDKTAPGRVRVDDTKAPRTILMSTTKGFFLFGDKPVGEIFASLQQLLLNDFFAKGRKSGLDEFILHYPHTDWQETVADLLSPKAPLILDHQLYFRFAQQKVNWQEQLPSGYKMVRIDKAMLERVSLKNLPYIKNWAITSFKTLPEFLDNGFGFGLLKGDEVVSWCLANCISGYRCEIGIHTDEAYRKQGFATLVAAATVEHCLANSLFEIGWHCWSINVASAATAEAVGFIKALEHPVVRIWFNAFDNLLANGNFHLLHRRYGEAASCYEKAFAEFEGGVNKDVLDSQLFANKTDRMRYYQQAACAHALAGDPVAADRNLEKAYELGGYRYRLA